MPSVDTHTPYGGSFVAFLDDHPEFDELSDRVLDELFDDDETYDRCVALGWFSGGDGS